MELPSSGAISLGNIQTEFGGSNPISLSEYYAGGGLVPSGTSGTNGPVPTSGTISISNFYGTSAVVYRLDANTYIDLGLFGVFPAQVVFRVNSNGTVEASTFNSGVVDSYNWLTPTTGSTTYYVRATLNSGSLNSGTTGVWEALTTDRVWDVFVSEFSSGFQNANLTIAIATDSGGTNIVVSANISLEASVS
jgi:hypothetical protein